jgi:hypothetical protein
MNNFHDTVNSSDVKRFASFVLLKVLKFVASTARTPVEVLIDVMIAAAARNSSIEQVCGSHENMPSGRTVRTHVALQLETLEDVEARINEGLRHDIPGHLRRQPIKVAMDYVEVCYHGKDADKDEIRGSKPKGGTSHFNTYATAYAVVKGERYTLAVTYVRASDGILDVTRRLNKRLNVLGIRVELYLLDRGYCSVETIGWLMRYGKPFIMPMIARGKKSAEGRPATGSRRLKEKNVSGWERYTMKSSEHGEVTFDAAVCCTNYMGRQGRKGRRTFVYATCGVGAHSLDWVRETYRTRFGIESSYRQMREAKIRTCTTDDKVRYLYVGIALILRNIWVWLHYYVFSTPQRGRRGRRIRNRLFTLDYLKHWLAAVIDETYVLIEQISPGRPLPLEILRFR